MKDVIQGGWFHLLFGRLPETCMPRGRWSLTWFRHLFWENIPLLAFKWTHNSIWTLLNLKKNSIIDLLAWCTLIPPIFVVNRWFSVNYRAHFLFFGHFAASGCLVSSLADVDKSDACAVWRFPEHFRPPRLLAKKHLYNPTYRFNLVSFPHYMTMAC